jgi:phage shock protein A
MSDKDSLRQAVAEEEARLARIKKEWAEVLARLRELKGRLATETNPES